MLLSAFWSSLTSIWISFFLSENPPQLVPLGKLVTPFAVGAGTKAYGATKDVFEGYRDFMKKKKEIEDEVKTYKEMMK